MRVKVLRARVKVGARVRVRVRVQDRVGRPGLGAHGHAQVGLGFGFELGLGLGLGFGLGLGLGFGLGSGLPGLGAHGDAQVKRCGAAGSAQVGVEPLDGSGLDTQVEQALQLGLRPASYHPCAAPLPLAAAPRLVQPAPQLVEVPQLALQRAPPREQPARLLRPARERDGRALEESLAVVQARLG